VGYRESVGHWKGERKAVDYQPPIVRPEMCKVFSPAPVWAERRFKRAVAVVGALVISCHAAFSAEGTVPFFRGKTINVVINFSAGGPADTEGRLVARHLSQHIPGNPVVIVQNMGGAGGIIGLNYVGQVAPKDGLTVAYTSGVAFAAALQESSVKVDVATLPLVAVGQSISTAYIRSDTGTGVRAPPDIMKQTGFWVAGLAPDSDKDIRLRMQLDLLGIKYNYLTGYPGTSEVRLAIQRNEAQMTAESMPSYRSAVEPLVAKGEITPLWYDDVSLSGSGAPDTSGIPAMPFLKFLQQQQKTPPSGLLYRSFLITEKVNTDFQRLIFMPPGSPPEAVDAMKGAFAALASDDDFKKDALASIKYVPGFLQGENVEQLLKASLKPGQEIVDFLHAYIEKGNSAQKK
jgi:tripartite-type tricarboxylate transporter receptor subunit TctC